MTFDTPEGLPTLLAIFDALCDGERNWIREDPKRSLEAHPVFAPVGDRFGRIPLESCLHVLMLLHNCNNIDTLPQTDSVCNGELIRHTRAADQWLLMAGCCQSEEPRASCVVRAQKPRQQRWRNLAESSRIVLRRFRGVA